jgi:hypothetical protein
MLVTIMPCNTKDLALFIALLVLVAVLYSGQASVET